MMVLIFGPHFPRVKLQVQEGEIRKVLMYTPSFNQFLHLLNFTKIIYQL